MFGRLGFHPNGNRVLLFAAVSDILKYGDFREAQPGRIV
jgi:hypothetical protein